MKEMPMRFFTQTAVLMAITSGAAGRVYGADPYTPLRLYEGTWKATSQSEGGAPTSKIIANECGRIGQFFGCQQTVDGKAGALILFLPSGRPLLHPGRNDGRSCHWPRRSADRRRPVDVLFQIEAGWQGRFPSDDQPVLGDQPDPFRTSGVARWRALGGEDVRRRATSRTSKAVNAS